MDTLEVNRFIVHAENLRVNYLEIFKGRAMQPVLDILQDYVPVWKGRLKESLEVVPTSEGLGVKMLPYGIVQEYRQGWISKAEPEIEKTVEEIVVDFLDEVAGE